MKTAVLALFLMTLQLQPVVGAIACLGADQSTKSHCPMPEDAPASDVFLGEPAEPVAHGCFLTQLCASGAPAVPKPAESFSVALQADLVSAVLAGSFHDGLPATPPFHPPRV